MFDTQLKQQSYLLEIGSGTLVCGWSAEKHFRGLLAFNFLLSLMERSSNEGLVSISKKLWDVIPIGGLKYVVY